MGQLFSQNGPSLQTEEKPDMNGPLAQEIQKTIAENKVVIYSKTFCPHCTEAKNIFKNLNAGFQTVELNEQENGGLMQSILKELTGARTVPRVFINGKCIGGCSQTKTLLESGQLETMLNDTS